MFLNRALAALMIITVTACDDEPRRQPPPTQADAQVVLDSGMNPPLSCDANPSACEPGRLIGAAPACECLPGCGAGYFWTGAMCVPIVDAGLVDATSGNDADGLPDGPVGFDGATTDDAAVAADVNTGTGGDVLMLDDASIGDAEAPPDGGPPPDGGGLLDGGAVVDTGLPPGADAGSPGPDVGMGDLGFGIGLAEGDQCDPMFNDCRQRPGMVCHPVTPTQGICLVVCDESQNTPGSLGNSTCTGLGRHCFDFYNLGPQDSRCLNSIDAYAEYGATNLDICAYGTTNTFRVPAGMGTPNGLCVPLCTVELSATTPLNVACQDPALASCDERGRRFQDGRGNFFGVCTATVTRGSHCEQLQGTSCDDPDRCFLGVCRQAIGATCTSTTICSDPTNVCVQQGLQNGGTIATCHQPCTLHTAAACGAGRACTVTSSGAVASPTVIGSCRAEQAQSPHGGPCSDVIGAAINQYTCADTTVCLPGPMTDWRQAQCRMLCDPGDPTRVMCPGTTNCTPFNAPFQTQGVCL